MRSDSVRLSSAVLVTVWMCATVATAQDVRPYIGGAVELSSFGAHSWQGSASETYSNTTNDTTALGVTVEAGAMDGPFAVGAEISLPIGRSTVTEAHGYVNPFDRVSQYNELSALAMFHIYAPTGRRVRPGALAGVGVVFQSSEDQVSACSFPHVSCSPFIAQPETNRRALVVTAGGDATIDVASHVSVIPQFRIVWVNQGQPFSDPSNIVALGVDSLVYQGSIGLRVRF